LKAYEARNRVKEELNPTCPRSEIKLSEPIQSNTSEQAESTPQANEVTFEDFQKIDIRIAKVKEVTRVTNSARLLKLKVDINGTEKQCIAGIGAKYEPDQLKEKLIAVVTNLKPRKIMGMTSEVMLLAAADGPEISTLVADRPVNSGAKVT
jgi:methionine--tRNA ligase beta chain